MGRLTDYQWLFAIAIILLTVTVFSMGSTRVTTKKIVVVTTIKKTPATQSLVKLGATNLQMQNSINQSRRTQAMAPKSGTKAIVTQRQSDLSTANTSSSGFSAGFIGGFEHRPSWATAAGKFYGESSIEGGVQLSPNISVSYQQQLMNNYYNSSDAYEDGPQLRLSDGLLRAKFNNVFTSGNMSFGYEPRIYMPTDESKATNGMITAIRNYLKLKQKFSETLALHFYEIPILHIYSQSGVAADPQANTPALANPAFENRVQLGLEAGSPSKVFFVFPLILRSTRYSDFAANANMNAQWGHILEIYPELTVALSNHVNLGLAYQSGSLVSADFSQFEFGKAFETGAMQFILGVTF